MNFLAKKIVPILYIVAVLVPRNITSGRGSWDKEVTWNKDKQESTLFCPLYTICHSSKNKDILNDKRKSTRMHISADLCLNFDKNLLDKLINHTLSDRSPFEISKEDSLKFKEYKENGKILETEILIQHYLQKSYEKGLKGLKKISQPSIEKLENNKKKQTKKRKIMYDQSDSEDENKQPKKQKITEKKENFLQQLILAEDSKIKTKRLFMKEEFEKVDLNRFETLSKKNNMVGGLNYLNYL